MIGGRPPVARCEWETGEPEQAHDWIRQAYPDHTPRLSGDRSRFRMRIASMRAEPLRIDHILHTMTVDAAVDPYRALVVAHPRLGRLSVRGRNGEFAQGPGGVLLLDPCRPSRVGWSPAIDEQVVRLELGPARQTAEDLTGQPADRVRFELSTAVSAAHARYGLGVVAEVHDILADDEMAAAPLVRAEAFRMLAVAAMTTFPNSAIGALAERPAPGTLQAEPAAIRRAVEFIDANAHRDISVGEIARAARLSTRGLQHAFRKHRDCTPLEHLRRVRIEGAHRDLQAADPTRGDTVAAIAARWGFPHAGRFSVEYRRVHGCSPRDTLVT